MNIDEMKFAIKVDAKDLKRLGKITKQVTKSVNKLNAAIEDTAIAFRVLESAIPVEVLAQIYKKGENEDERGETE